MTTQTSTLAVHTTFVLERSYPQAPERVFSAFAQPERKRLWYAEGDHEIQEFEMDFRAGGSERFGYRFKEGHPIAGSEIANESTYHQIVPDERIVMTARMSLNGKPILVQLLTIEFVRAGQGTDLVLTNQGTYLDWEGGPQMIEAGWRGLMDRLQTYLAQ
jgi:uncharacterized protein YndB with AHSA1/START domain